MRLSLGKTVNFLDVNMSQDWCRLLVVGDITILMIKVVAYAVDDDVPDEVKIIGSEIYCTEIEFRMNDNVYLRYWYYDSEQERDEDFELIDEERLTKLIMMEIE